MQDVLASPVYRDLSTAKLAVGDRAYDFDLTRRDASREPLRLSSFAGDRPVALVFGSYT